MTATWPSQIKFCPVDRAISYQAEKGFYEFQPDAGAPQRLPSTTGLKKTIVFQILVDAAGRQVLETFYHSDCSNGADDFTAPDIYDQSKTVTYWWEEPPAFANAGPSHFYVKIKIGTLMP